MPVLVGQSGSLSGCPGPWGGGIREGGGSSPGGNSQLAMTWGSGKRLENKHALGLGGAALTAQCGRGQLPRAWGQLPRAVPNQHSPLCAGQLANTVPRDFFVTSELPAVTPRPFQDKDYALVECAAGGPRFLKNKSCTRSRGRPATQLDSFCLLTLSKMLGFSYARTRPKNTSIHKYFCIHKAGNKTLFSKCGGSVQLKIYCQHRTSFSVSHSFQHQVCH